jgi:hypothetical protein
MTVPKVKHGVRTKMSVKYKHVEMNIEAMVRNVHYDQTILKKQTCTGITCSFGKQKANYRRLIHASSQNGQK